MIPLVAETWLWYTIVVVVFLARFASRIIHQGSVKALQSDDWIMWLALITYTADISCLNITANANTNLFPDGFDYSTLTTADIAGRVYGSKMVLVVEEMQCATVWLTKACILIMYLRLTKGRAEHKWVKALAIYTGSGYVIMEILYLGVWCRPFKEYYAVPTDNTQCNTALHHLIVNATFNLSSDLILLCIAIPMFLRTQMPLRKKAALISVFSLGIFVMICAILNKYYSFTNPFGSEWTYWYCRESSTSMLVANIPFVYTLLRRIFKLKSLDSSRNYPYDAYGSKTGGRNTRRTGNQTATVKSRMGGTLMSRNRDPEAGDEIPFVSLAGITKEVGVTFMSQPAPWGKSGNKGNMVTITANEMMGTEEARDEQRIGERDITDIERSSEEKSDDESRRARRVSGVEKW